MKLPKVDRRQVIAGGAGVAALTIAFALWPRTPSSALRAARPGEKVFGPFLRIDADGRVTVAVPQTETGQGAWTGLAQVAADELGAAWEMVGVEPAPVGPDFANPMSKQVGGTATMLTAGSSSIRAFERPMREAAAMARALLCEAAAARWKVRAAECQAVGGAVLHEGKRLEFGALVEDASRRKLVSAPLRPRGSGELAGQSLPRLDLAAKASGSWRFAGDVRLPGMKFASVRVAPPGGRITGWDRAAASRPDIRLVEQDGWLAAIGPTWWAADQALKRAGPTFSGPANADTPGIEAALHAALDAGDFTTLASAGDYDETVDGRRPLAATYLIAPAPHLSLEPPAAVARWVAGRLELWVASQAPALARDAVAKAAGIDTVSISLYPMSVGDGQGRALDPLPAIIAAELARQAGVAVALTLPASTAHNHDWPRAPWLARMSALANAAGGLDSWHAQVVGAGGMAASLDTLSGKSAPHFAPRGVVPPYAIGATRIEAATASLPALRTGYMRGGEEAMGAFLTETFIDELARARGAEPLAFRIGLLGGRPRLARVLQTAASVGGWDGGARGSNMGIACASAFGSHIALLAEASIGSDQRVRVTRLIAAVDAGRLVNPGLVRQQVEGGLLATLTSAIGPASEIIAGLTRARPLAALGLGRLADVPRIDVELVASGAPAGGVSGLGACVLAPALGNALYAATGLRLRRLPFDPNSPA